MLNRECHWNQHLWKAGGRWALRQAWHPEMTTWEALELKWPDRVVLCEAERVSPWHSCLNQLSNVDHPQKDVTSGEEVLPAEAVPEKTDRWSLSTDNGLSSWGTSPSLKVHLVVHQSVHHGWLLKSRLDQLAKRVMQIKRCTDRAQRHPERSGE